MMEQYKTLTGQYPFKTAVVQVSVVGGVPTFAFSSDAGDVRFMQFTVWREGNEQPLWSIVVAKEPHEYALEPNEPRPETEDELLEAAFRQSVARIASGDGSIRVRRLSYGEVPRGFLQQIPPRGQPPQLGVGSYFLSVAGQYVCATTFKIEGP